jgi:23S rRNA pseudouridine2605 synthase
MERLQKVIANSGVTSRRKAEELILEGKVTVNGIVVKELGTKVGQNEIIEVNGMKLAKEALEYYLFYKPRGVVSTTSDDKGRKTLLDFFDTKTRIYPIGRLDYDTTGIIILTNDGDLANLMMHPKGEIEKVYITKIEGFLTGANIGKLKHGIMLDGKMTSPAKVKVRSVDKNTNTSIVELTIHEGRYHQIKRMFENIGIRVEKLKRERIAFLTLEGLNAGDYRRLTIKEVKKLYALIKKDNQ